MSKARGRHRWIAACRYNRQAIGTTMDLNTEPLPSSYRLLERLVRGRLRPHGLWEPW